jgi:hypothetical protein
MADNFFGFSPDAFEQFVRALSIHVFGPGVTAFGPGPDGGREATFRGIVPYPSPSDQWSGYGVIQAKCKGKSEGSELDQKWALKLLEKELELFVEKSSRTNPDYYVFVTNVSLSSDPRGGRAAAEELLSTYAQDLGLKGHAVWDANQLTAYLATYEQLRTRFNVFLTPGDVLGAMLEDLQSRQQNAGQVLRAYVERGVRADEAARLDQAGRRIDEQLHLARLFIDLPAYEQERLGPVEPEFGSERLPPGVLAELLTAGSRKLDPAARYELETSTDGTNGLPATYVLLGGPGSGKSTVTQFLAQIHRAALLERGNPALLDSQTRTAIAEIRTRADEDELPWPLAPRYPFRVDLNRFAKALAERANSVEGLGDYLRRDLQRHNTLTHDALLDWLSMYPWLLVLDGLDEVPATSNREAVVTAIQDFLIDARQREADHFVVITSRRQGYGGEFSQERVGIRYMAPLSVEHALRYATRYADAAFGTRDPQKRDLVIETLQQTSQRPLTAQLMTSPLQVTFMATVVGAQGDPGEDRWQLFDGYYTTIYNRERQKAVPPYDLILSKRQKTITQLHHDIGFLLQLKGESLADGAVSLPLDVFERAADAYLDEEGHDESQRKELVAGIVALAEQRLVFLTSRVRGQLSFEVRSLQEFMAAECIMSGLPELVIARLQEIAPVPYWRNVWLFAAGKCFADVHSRHLQDRIGVLCEDVNSSDERILSETYAGSELALDVLDSGVVAENPRCARRLAKVALQLLARPYVGSSGSGSAAVDQRLANLYRGTLESVYRAELELRIGQAEVTRTLGAWPLLIRLADGQVPWAVKLASAAWPVDGELLPLLWQHVPDLFERSSFLRHAVSKNAITRGIDAPGFARVFGRLALSEPRDVDAVTTLRGFRVANNTHSPDFLEGVIVFDEASRTALTLIVRKTNLTDTNARAYAKLRELAPLHPSWSPFVFLSGFAEKPGRETLADLLTRCADAGWSGFDVVPFSHLPWPVAACLEAGTSKERLYELAEQARAGELGDLDTWMAAEERWERGIQLGELILDERTGSLDSLTASRGAPPAWWLRIEFKERPLATLESLFAAAEASGDPVMTKTLADALFAYAGPSGGLVKSFPPARVRKLLAKIPSRVITWRQIGLGSPTRGTAEWLDFYDWLGMCVHDTSSFFRTSYRDVLDGSDSALPLIKHLEVSFCENPGLLGILRLLASATTVRQTLIPLDLLQRSFDDPYTAFAALIVRLKRPGGLAHRLAALLAHRAAELMSSSDIASRAEKMLFGAVAPHLHRSPRKLPQPLNS